MQINVTYDSSVDSAPAGYKVAVQAAVKFFEDTFDADITVNINFGWGEVGGQAIDPGALGESLTQYVRVPYAVGVGALLDLTHAPATAGAVLALPDTPPPDAAIFELPYAQARLIEPSLVPDGLAQDGYVGLDSTASYTFDLNNRSVAGEYDAIGALEHEISEVLGRQTFDGQQALDGGASRFTLLDFFRLSAPGTHTYDVGPGYFSLNGDQLLLPFNDPSNGGDSGDWSPDVTGDSFDAFADTGTAQQVSAVDLRVLELLGYHLSPNAPTPNGTPTAPLVFNQNLTLNAGQTLNFDGPLALVMNKSGAVSPTLTNSATIIDTGARSQTDVIGLTSGYAAGGTIGADQNSGPITTTFQNTATGTLNVTATADGADAVGVYSGPGVVNAGLIQVTSNKADAWGIYGDAFTNTSTGTLKVQAVDYATGVNLLAQGGAFSNAGLIDVTGLHAIGVEGMTSFTNSGTLRVTGVGSGATSVAVYIAAPYGTSFSNSGLIQAQDAFLVDPTWRGGAFPDISITNSGTINGRITFVNANNQIHNTGAITGAIHFGDGNSIYAGVGGTQSGGIYLGHGNNTVTLGNDGEAVYGGGGSDTIGGGSGNDFIEIARGTNSINGGGGFNTLSLADSDVGVTVNLGSGTLVGAGTSTLANIQQVVGSNFNDTLIAGSAGATLIGGGGQNILTGGAGNDTLVAGTGGDTVTGNGGADTFIYTAGDHQLVINDFRANGNDVLDIYGYGSAGSVQLQGSDTLITLSGGDSILLKGFTSSVTGHVVYNAASYQGPSLPASLPVFGTTTIKFTYDLTIGAAETLNELNQHVGLVDVGGGSPGPDAFFHALDNFGTINVSTASGDVAGLTTDSSATYQPGHNITNEAGAIFSVTDTDPTGVAKGLSGGTLPVVVNAGSFAVTAAGDAYGLETYATNSEMNTASGAITISSSAGTAYGIYAYNGAQFVNSGTLHVTGADAAYGVWTYRFQSSSVVNNGDITVSSGTPEAYGLYLGNFGNGTVTNTGTITAETAIKAGQLALTNSGTIQGAIALGDGDSQIHNTGSITGAIHFGHGDALYDGVSGTLSGAIYLGHGTNIVDLGDDGGTVYGGGGTDYITGGSGDDFIEIGRGTNNVDGGGGFNTLSLADSDVGVIVNLAAGTLSGAGASTIANIQQVVGSNFNDTLIAGSTAATLIGGGGQDILTGGAGNDTLVAGTGGDTATGNGGADTFIYTAGDHQLVINDFLANSNSDILEIYGYGSASSIQQQGSDTLITLSGSDTILLKNVLPTALTGSNVIYNAAAYQGPSLPASLPVYFSSDAPIEFTYDLTIYAGEALHIVSHTSDLNINENMGLWDVTSDIAGPVGVRARNFDNSGTVTVSSSDPGLFGMLLNYGRIAQITNEAGASFAVSDTADSATGIAISIEGVTVSNAGMFTVTAQALATGISGAAETDNGVSGQLNVTSLAGDAVGMNLALGGVVENDGTIVVRAAGTAYGAQGFASEVAHGFVGSITNSGTISAQSSDPAAATYGIAVSASYNPSYQSYITNTGTITAKTAILNADGGDGFTPLTVDNSGTINGDVDLGGSNSMLTNSGTITGDIIFATVTNQVGGDPAGGIFPPWIINTGSIVGNIHLADNDGTVTSSGAITGSIYVSDGNDTIDLRGGSLTGAVVISPAVAGKATHDDIFTGAAGGLISIHAGDANLTATITAGGPTTVQYDIASTAASYVRNANGTVTVSAGNDGTETLTNVSALQFTDRTVTSASIPYAPPSVTTANIKRAHGLTLALSSLFTASGVAGSITRYELFDSTSDPNSGHFVVNGVTQPAGTIIDITASQLAQTGFVTGSVGDSLQIRAFDGSSWSAADNVSWAPFTITVPANHPPVVTTANRTLAAGSTVALSSLFSVNDADGDAMTRYQLLDSSDDPKSGHFVVGGVVQPAGTVIDVTAAQLSQVTFVTGRVSDNLEIRASDGVAWSAGSQPWAPFTISPSAVKAEDFNGDGNGDLLWQNDSGQASIWLLNGTALAGGFWIGSNPGPTWHVKATGDFDGDGKSDVLWQNDGGQASVWLMNGTTMTQAAWVGPNPGPTWHALTTGDFDGDGRSDIVWQNDSGQAAVWLMNGTTPTQTSWIGPNPGPSWHVKATGDFDGDGKSDILLQNDSGQAAIWLMDGTTMTQAAWIGPNPGPTWHVEGAGDFNGDGKSDILWQNDSGQAAIWLMNGTTLTQASWIGPNPGPTWHVQAARDFDGDGNSDVLWRNDSGQASIWLMSGTTLNQASLIGPNPGNSWHIATG